MAEINEDIVRLKLKSLRQYFFKELKKIRDAPSGSEGKVTAKWEFFECLSFLTCTIKDEHNPSWSLPTPMATPAPTASTTQPSALHQATMEPEEDIIAEVTLSINEDGEFFDHPTCDSLSLPDLTTDSSRPSSGSSVSVPIQSPFIPHTVQEGLMVSELVNSETPKTPALKRVYTTSNSSSPHSETSKSPALKRGAKRKLGQGSVIESTLGNISDFLLNDEPPKRETFASTTGKSVEHALEYFPLDAQFALGSKILQVVHTFTEQYKEKHPS
ncbi:hypothetical protein Pmani_008241 [Petrolisthes manimaculis]|uniref:MADF domain-containing protein n=1 Tax=Petrolisthes manimaculis TaxID=1843537 RepID=A0AAE1Q701_9EUCA|nr:hypothetical protein Pmani_008241 [Petrolisthes manimaculis]